MRGVENRTRDAQLGDAWRVPAIRSILAQSFSAMNRAEQL